MWMPRDTVTVPMRFPFVLKPLPAALLFFGGCVLVRAEGRIQVEQRSFLAFAHTYDVHKVPGGILPMLDNGSFRSVPGNHW